MAEVNFYLKNPKAKNKSAIYLSFPFNGERIQTPTGLGIHPNKWRNGKIKHQYSHESWYHEYNDRLHKIKQSIETHYNTQIALGVLPTTWAIKRHLTETFSLKVEKEQEKLFFSVYEEFLMVRANEVSPSTIKKYRTLLNLLREFDVSKRIKLSFDNIDLSFFDQFKAFLYSKPNKRVPSGEGMIDDTVNKYISVLKTFMTWTQERGHHSNEQYRKFSVRIKKKHEIITLGINDIKKIEELDLSSSSRLKKVRDIFMFGFHTLQRWSDIANFSKEDLYYDQIKKYNFWKFESQKTKEKIIIPFTGFSIKAYEILEKNDFKLPKISADKFNNYLKELGELAGLDRIETKHRIQANKKITIRKKLYEFMSSHIMRRSSITFLLEQGVPPTTILKLTGHEDITTLMKYENTSMDAVEKSLLQVSSSSHNEIVSANEV